MWLWSIWQRNSFQEGDRPSPQEAKLLIAPEAVSALNDLRNENTENQENERIRTKIAEDYQVMLDLDKAPVLIDGEKYFRASDVNGYFYIHEEGTIFPIDTTNSKTLITPDGAIYLTRKLWRWEVVLAQWDDVFWDGFSEIGRDIETINGEPVIKVRKQWEDKYSYPLLSEMHNWRLGIRQRKDHISSRKPSQFGENLWRLSEREYLTIHGVTPDGISRESIWKLSQLKIAKKLFSNLSENFKNTSHSFLWVTLEWEVFEISKDHNYEDVYTSALSGLDKDEYVVYSLYGVNTRIIRKPWENIFIRSSEQPEYKFWIDLLKEARTVWLIWNVAPQEGTGSTTTRVASTPVWDSFTTPLPRIKDTTKVAVITNNPPIVEDSTVTEGLISPLPIRKVEAPIIVEPTKASEQQVIPNEVQESQESSAISNSLRILWELPKKVVLEVKKVRNRTQEDIKYTKALQEILQVLFPNESILADGIYWPITKTFVLRFQQSLWGKIGIDGKVGPMTKRELLKSFS